MKESETFDNLYSKLGVFSIVVLILAYFLYQDYQEKVNSRENETREIYLISELKEIQKMDEKKFDKIEIRVDEIQDAVWDNESKINLLEYKIK